MPTLTARTLITAIGTIAYPAIEIDSAGLITDISSDVSIRSDKILTPTFLDIHIHGAAGHGVMNAKTRRPQHDAALPRRPRHQPVPRNYCHPPPSTTPSAPSKPWPTPSNPPLR